MMGVPDASANSIRFSNYYADRLELQSVLERFGGQETDANVGHVPEHFLFLGQRLADLKRFGMSQKPYDWKSILWRDRRKCKELVYDVDGVGCARNRRRHAGAPISSAAVTDQVDVSSMIISSLYIVYGTGRVGVFTSFGRKLQDANASLFWACM